uniref:Histone-lysine N-methyltransferase SETMAR n=1 Tax=Strongyloides venezuelensis TaxID=75913 RepID=A0A0K0FQM7_STRVS
MVSIWKSWDVILHYEFMKPGETVNSQLYCSQLEKVHQKLSKKKPSLTNRKGPILLHDNARPHHLDLFLKEKVFKNDECIKSTFEDFIASGEPNFYSNGKNIIVSRWERCVLSNGSYFKKNINLSLSY